MCKGISGQQSCIWHGLLHAIGLCGPGCTSHLPTIIPACRRQAWADTHTHRDTGMQNYSENCPTISSKLSEMRQGHVFDAKIEPSLGLMDLGLQESSQTSQESSQTSQTGWFWMMHLMHERYVTVTWRMWLQAVSSGASGRFLCSRLEAGTTAALEIQRGWD